MKLLDESPLRELRDNERPTFTRGWAWSPDGQLCLIPKPEVKSIYLIDQKPQQVGTQVLGVVPICIQCRYYGPSQLRLYIADREGQIWIWSGTVDELLRNSYAIMSTKEPVVNRVSLEKLISDMEPGLTEYAKVHEIEMNVWKLEAVAATGLQNDFQVFAAGAIGHEKLKGSILVLSESGEIRHFISGIDEAPTDICFSGESFYVATGRGGIIEKRQTRRPTTIDKTIRSEIESDLFAPARIMIHPKDSRRLWIASYNMLFEGNDDLIESARPLTDNADCVNDFDFSSDGTKIYACCTFSDRVVSFDVTKGEIDGEVMVEQPSLIKVIGSRAYVLGHTNEVVSVLQL